MRITIPFISRLPAGEATCWQQAIASLLPDCDIVLFDDLPAQQLQQCRVAIVANPDPAELERLPQLRWVHSVWAGVERMLQELPHLPMDIVRLVDPKLSQTMAEAVLAWTLYLHREMPAYRRQQNTARWYQRPYVETSARRVGILGLGELGQASARCLRDNGFSVTGWSRTEKTLSGIDVVAGAAGLQALLKSSDIVVNLLPLTPETRGILSAKEFAVMKATASVMNFGRGTTVNVDDLVAALDRQQIAHAVLDVFEEEPLPPQSPLWAHPAITVLPHISGPTSIDSASRIVAHNLQTFLKTGVLPPVVDRVRGY